MMRETVVPLLVIALVAGAGWYYREPLQQQLSKSRAAMAPAMTPPPEAPATPPEAAPPAPRQDTIYRWVDENGGVHYEQKQVEGSQAVVIDQSRIQSMDRYGKPAADANGTPVVEADGDAPRKSLRAVDRFPQAQSGHL